MTLRAELRENWRSNPWMLWQVACLPVMAAWLVLAIVFSLGLPGALLGLLPDAAFAVCSWKASRTARALRTAREEAEFRAREEPARLRTLAAPNAPAGIQCPVCGMTDLSELAADDRFMERGDRSRVVPYGTRRAHRDCAEFVPYKAPKADRAALGVIYTCRFCDEQRHAPTMAIGEARLIAHSRQCPKRPHASVLNIANGGTSLASAAEVLRMLGQGY